MSLALAAIGGLFLAGAVIALITANNESKKITPKYLEPSYAISGTLRAPNLSPPSSMFHDLKDLREETDGHPDTRPEFNDKFIDRLHEEMGDLTVRSGGSLFMHTGFISSVDDEMPTREDLRKKMIESQKENNECEAMTIILRNLFKDKITKEDLELYTMQHQMGV